MPEFSFTVDTAENGMRLDLLLIGFAGRNQLGVSRTSLQKLIEAGRVSISGAAQLKPHHKVKAGDTVSFDLDEPRRAGPEPEDIPLDVVYEDEDVAVVNKEQGIVVHPAPGNYEHTLVNALLKRFGTLSDVDPQRPGIVHRLDKDTSGLIVVAKNNLAHHDLTKQFSVHSIQRTYVALVRGVVEFDEDVIEMPIRRHPYKRTSMSVGFTDDAKYAKTRYRTLKRLKDASLLELKPFTGRTHQLRVHLSYIGHPILGDATYGRRTEFPRLALHALSIGFTHPRTGKLMEFSSALPPEFEEFVEKNKA